MMPPTRSLTPKGAAIMPADKRVGEGFRPNPHHARRTHMTNSRPLPSPPQHLHWKRPGIVESTTTAPTTSTSQPLDTATMTTPHQQRRRHELGGHRPPWAAEASRGQASRNRPEQPGPPLPPPMPAEGAIACAGHASHGCRHRQHNPRQPPSSSSCCRPRTPTPPSTTQTRALAARPPDPTGTTPDLGALASASAEKSRRREELQGAGGRVRPKPPEKRGRRHAPAIPAGRTSSRWPAPAAARRGTQRPWRRLGLRPRPVAHAGGDASERKSQVFLSSFSYAHPAHPRTETLEAARPATRLARPAARPHPLILWRSYERRRASKAHRTHLLKGERARLPAASRPPPPPSTTNVVATRGRQGAEDASSNKPSACSLVSQDPSD
jgi:hypothetical protein